MTGNDDEAPEEADHALVMPFVVCQPDGPYEPSAFVAGAEFQAIHHDLQAVRSLRNVTLTRARFEKYVPPALVSQPDLVAMECGFTLTATPWGEHPDEWVLAVFEFKDVSEP